MKLSSLKEHPANSRLYDNSDIYPLVSDIKKNGLNRPIEINQKGQILSGHRRWKALMELGNTEVDCIVHEFENIENELEYILSENLYRVKSTTELTREAMLLEKIESLKAKKRMMNGKKVAENRDPSTESVLGSVDETGKAATIAAKKTGIGRDRYDHAKKALVQIDSMQNEDKRNFYSSLLNKNTTGTLKALKVSLYDKISQEEKENLIKGDTTIRKLMDKESTDPAIQFENEIKKIFKYYFDVKAEMIVFKEPDSNGIIRTWKIEVQERITKSL